MADGDYVVEQRSRTRIFILFSLILLVGVLVWAIFFRTTNTPTKNTQHSQGKVATAPPSSTSKSGNNTNSSKGSPSSNTGGGSNSSAAGSSANANGNTGPGSSQLANTGPDNDVAVFIGATLVGMSVYYVRLHTKKLRAER